MSDMRLVDLRSDTVTRPTTAMRTAMAAAEVGDDQYGEDPTVRALEGEAAALLGKEAALFVVSGTMGNQLALRILTRPGDGVVAGARQHVVAFEDGAGPLNAGISWLTLGDADGTLDPERVAGAAAGSRHHLTSATLLAIEDTHMASGGRVWPPARRRAVQDAARSGGLGVHLDGGRLWNAAVSRGVSPAEVAEGADTVMCCLSKGLAAPIGSILAGRADLIERARYERHRLGGAWRQAGILAAAGLVALRDMRERLIEDHLRAGRLAATVAERWPGSGAGPEDGGGVEPSATEALPTNMVVFVHPDPDSLLAHLRDRGVLAGTIAPGTVRLVTHLDVDDADIDRACDALAAAPR